MRKTAGMTLVDILISMALAAVVIFAAIKLSLMATKDLSNADDAMGGSNLLVLAFEEMAKDLQQSSVLQARRLALDSKAFDPLYCGDGRGLMQVRPAVRQTRNFLIAVEDPEHPVAAGQVTAQRDGNPTINGLTLLVAASSQIGKLVLASDNRSGTILVADGSKLQKNDLVMLSGRKPVSQVGVFMQVTDVPDGNKAKVKLLSNFSFSGERPCKYSYNDADNDLTNILAYMEDDIVRIDQLQQVQYRLQAPESASSAKLVKLVWRDITAGPEERAIVDKIATVDLQEQWEPLPNSALQGADNSYLGTTSFIVMVNAPMAVGAGAEKTDRTFTGEVAYTFTSSGKANYELLLEGFVYQVVAPDLSMASKVEKQQEDDQACQGSNDYDMFKAVHLTFNAAEAAGLTNARMAVQLAASANPHVRCRFYETPPSTYPSFDQITNPEVSKSFLASSKKSIDIFCCVKLGQAAVGNRFLTLNFVGTLAGTAKYTYGAKTVADLSSSFGEVKDKAKFAGASWDTSYTVAVEQPQVVNPDIKAAELDKLQQDIKTTVNDCELDKDILLNASSAGETLATALDVSTKITPKICQWKCPPGFGNVDNCASDAATGVYTCNCDLGTQMSFEGGCTKYRVAYRPRSLLEDVTRLGFQNNALANNVRSSGINFASDDAKFVECAGASGP